MEIKIDDLSGQDIANFLKDHMDDMKVTSPPESIHAFDIESLRQSEITFWAMWSNDQLVCCGALKELSSDHGEIKSMRTSKGHRGKGMASSMLKHIIAEAIARNYQRLSLETGSQAFFQPACKLYERHGFFICSPFANYKEDVNSIFMSKLLN